MANPSLAALQVAVLAALKASSAVQAQVGSSPARVYGHVPEGDVTEPYLVLADLTVAPDDDKTTPALVVTMTIEAVSRDYRGHGDVLECLDAVYGVLHRATLSVTGNTCTLTRFVGGDTSRDEDGLTYRGSATYDFLIRGT